MAQTHDPKCHELAEHFLQDTPHIHDRWLVNNMANAIQQAIEDWFSDIDNSGVAKFKQERLRWEYKYDVVPHSISFTLSHINTEHPDWDIISIRESDDAQTMIIYRVPSEKV